MGGFFALHRTIFQNFSPWEVVVNDSVWTKIRVIFLQRINCSYTASVTQVHKLGDIVLNLCNCGEIFIHQIFTGTATGFIYLRDSHMVFDSMVLFHIAFPTVEVTFACLRNRKWVITCYSASKISKIFVGWLQLNLEVLTRKRRFRFRHDGVPPVIIHFNGIFPWKSNIQRFLGFPHDELEPPIYLIIINHY